MEIIKTDIPDLLIIKPTVFEDDRGYFYESFNLDKYNKHNLDFNFVQDNQSKSDYGVLRGLHYQLAPYAQTKLVRALDGVIYDVGVDIREGSPTFGKWFGIELSAKNKLQLLVPRGFAHGFSVLSDTATVFYKCDSIYNKEAERGIAFNDPKLNIDWKIQNTKTILSARDRVFPLINDADMNFIYGQI